MPLRIRIARRASQILRLCVIAGLMSPLVPAALLAQPSIPPPAKELIGGEELVYNVRYGFIDLGQVRIWTADKERKGDYVAYYSKALIDSYKGVPFVDLHAIYESWIDTAVFSRAFVGKSREDDMWDFTRFGFQYDDKRVFVERGTRDTVVERRDTMKVQGLYQDGLSLFFYARDQLFSGKRMNVPTMIQDKQVSTYIDFTGEHTSVEVDAIQYPVDVVAFEGEANFVGIFGLTGGFEGWFSNDEARVPILAKMKVIIGSVTIELMRWKRLGWTPPRGED